MDKHMDLLEMMTLLKPIPAEQIKALLKDGRFKISTYRKNSIVHLEDDRCTKMEVILSGMVTVERIDIDGRLMTVAEFFSDDIIGGNLLFSKNPYYPMTIRSKLATMVLEINKDVLLELFTNNINFLHSYLGFVSDHAFYLGDKIKHYVNRTIRECILSFLRYESKRQNSNNIILPMTKKALAEKIGVQRTSLSRELTKMEKDGLIKFDSKSITLLENG